jgi:hypothetical protein
MTNAGKLARNLNTGKDTVARIMGRYTTAQLIEDERFIRIRFLNWKLTLLRDLQDNVGWEVVPLSIK